MAETTDEDSPALEQAIAAKVTRIPTSFMLLVFGFGLAAGFLLAFSGYGLEDSASLVITIFLGLIMTICLIGIFVFLFRKWLMQRLFGVAEAQMEQFVGPLARVAEGAADRDPTGTVQASRDLLQLTFARFAWVSTRRWIIGSLTGLIAAMAALSGTALLFKQNQLLEKQSVFLAQQTDLLGQQNERITEQSALMAKQVELAEADRSAALASEMLNIAALLGAALDKSEARLRAGGVPELAGGTPVLDAQKGIGQSLRMRIISASRANRPYRFLRPDLRSHDYLDKMREASLWRQDDLPDFYSQITGGLKRPARSEPVLVDRLASPERAQLLQIMMFSGLRDFELLNFMGLDLSFAYAPDMQLFGISTQAASLSYADFTRADVTGCDFRGSMAENIRFDSALIKDTNFGVLTKDNAKPPLNFPDQFSVTSLIGTSFQQSYLRNVDFSGSRATLANFDKAILRSVNFRDTALPGATFRGSVLLNVDFTGASVQSIDLDGAFVTRGDFLEHLNDVAYPATFKPDRFTLKEVAVEEALNATQAYRYLDLAEMVETVGSHKMWQITRVGAFE